MADILGGSTGHTNFAPLSKDQTVKIAQHLQEQIKFLQEQVQELKVGANQSSDTVAALRSNLDNTNNIVYTMQEGVASTNITVDNTKNDLARTRQGVLKLNAGFEQCTEQISSLREAQKIASTNVQKVSQDLEQNVETTHAVRDDIERRIGTNFEKLTDHVHRLDLALKQLTEYDELDKVAAQEAKEGLRKSETTVRNLRDDLTKTNTVLHMLEQQLTGEAGSGVKGYLRETRALLDDTTAQMMKLQEDHEHTKAHLQDTQGALRKAQENIKNVSHNLDTAKQNLDQTSLKIDGQMGVLSVTGQRCEQLQSKVQTLNEGHDMAHATIRMLQQELSDTQQSASQTKAALKETQAIVLPNLHMDLPHLGGSGGLPNSARPNTKHGHIRKVPAQGTQKEDANRMAWI